jgi:hypothetical protein
VDPGGFGQGAEVAGTGGKDVIAVAGHAHHRGIDRVGLPLRASSILARLPRTSSTAVTSVPASIRAGGACRPVPPRQTWATTPPLVTGTRPARRSRLTRTTTSRSPRSAATNAPASSTSITLPPGGDLRASHTAPSWWRASATSIEGITMSDGGYPGRTRAEPFCTLAHARLWIRCSAQIGHSVVPGEQVRILKPAGLGVGACTAGPGWSELV